MTESSGTPTVSPHFRCDCVPDLGPAHCHRCSQKAGKIISWDDADCAVFVDAIAGLVDVHADGVAEAIDLLITKRLSTPKTAHRPIPAPVDHDIEPKPGPIKDSALTPSSLAKTSPPLMGNHRPASAGWSFTNLAISQLDELQIDKDEIVERVKAAPVTQPSADGNARNHYHEDLLILVDEQCVISVVKHEPSSVEPAPRSDGAGRTRRRKKISGGPGRKMPGSTKDLRRMLEKKDFTVERQANNHLRVTHAEHPDALFVIASSPSDHHSMKNSIAEIRKVTGIDITQP